MDSDGNIQLFGGKILRLRNDCYWRGSSWETADILWNGNDGLQTISMFETMLEDPIALYPSIPQDIRLQIISSIQSIAQNEYAGRFGSFD